MKNDIVSYYSERAKEYEEIYFKPERQNELKKITGILQKIFFQKDVLEIACGTGYWTERIAGTAKSILATDINNSVLEIAKSKNYLNNNVRFQKRDLFSLKPKKKFESLFGGFIWSHIKLQGLDNFVLKINNLIDNNGTIFFVDNNYVEGSSTPITEKDEFGNTYQTRKLKDGSSHLVLKNFPIKKFLYKKVKGKVKEIDFINLKYYWALIYRL